MCEHRSRVRVPGWLGWLGLAGYVIAWDLHPDTESLSHSFAPCGSHGRRAALGLWVYVTVHLIRAIPDRYDPLRIIPTIRRKET